MGKKILYGLAVGLGAAAVSLALWLGGFLDTWEYGTWTWRVRSLAEPSPTAGRVKVILLDQASLDWGKNENGWSWPWPREVYGPLIDFCKRQGARAVAFDVIFSEPSVYGVGDDQALGAAIQRAPAFAGAVVLGSQAGVTTAWPEWLAKGGATIDGWDAWLKTSQQANIIATNAAFPIADVATNVTLLANVSDLPDRDGLFRRATLFKVFDGRVLPSLGLACYLAGEQAAGADVKLRIEKGWFHVGDRKIPIDDLGRSILRFQAPSGTHESYSAAAVIQSELRLQGGEKPVIENPETFKDCYVFFGFSAPGLLDLRPTPMSKVYPGVEVHATMLDNLLSRVFLQDLSAGIVILAAVLLALLSGIAVTLSRKAWQSVLAFVVFLPIPALLGLAAYRAGYWWPVVVGELGVALSLVSAVVVNYATEGRQKAFIKNAFKFYVGPEVIDQMLADPKRLKLGGEKRELTLYFSDIEKFSSFSEKLDPEQLTSLLNDFLSEMGQVIKEEGGYLDKYIGDAIVAFWNAPIGQPDHAIRACRAALRCQRRLAELRGPYEQKYGATVKMRIGLNSGPVTVGNMGSRDRFNYTVLGDAANLASRLEGANKAFGTYLMVSEATWSQTNSQFLGRELSRLTVVGRKTPVKVFQLVGLAGEQAPAWFPAFAEGLQLFYAGKFADALKRFEPNADDPASVKYAERCRALIQSPPPQWEGVWNLTEKG